MLNFIQAFWNDEEGAAAIEYALIAALIAVAIGVGVGAFGTSLNGFFQNLFTELKL